MNALLRKYILTKTSQNQIVEILRIRFLHFSQIIRFFPMICHHRFYRIHVFASGAKTYRFFEQMAEQKKARPPHSLWGTNGEAARGCQEAACTHKKC